MMIDVEPGKAMEFSGINERSALLKEAFKALVDRRQRDDRDT
jgi:hypothetical protein